MKTSKKIIIICSAVVLAVIIALGVVFGVVSHKVPELDDSVKRANIFEKKQTYVLAQNPYTDTCVFETQNGMFGYWTQSHKYGKGIEAVLQCTKDGEIIVLSEDLPGKSNAEILFGEGIKVQDLTLEQLQQINLAYDFEDEDGVMSFKSYEDEMLSFVNVLSLKDFCDFFGSPIRSSALLYFSFKDESLVSDYKDALDKIYTQLSASLLFDRAMFCTDNKDIAAYIDESCPELLRSATKSEVKSLYWDCLKNKTQEEVGFDCVIVKADTLYSTEKFVHYVRNLGIPIVFENVKTEDVLTYRSWGVSALATNKIDEFSEILEEARSAEREAKKAKD